MTTRSAAPLPPANPPSDPRALYRQPVALLLDGLLIGASVLAAVWLDKVFLLAALALLLYFIPFCEWRFGRTPGMALVGNRILLSAEPHHALGVVWRRHLARLGLVWAVLGWAAHLAHRGAGADYRIVRAAEIPAAALALDEVRLSGFDWLLLIWVYVVCGPLLLLLLAWVM